MANGMLPMPLLCRSVPGDVNAVIVAGAAFYFGCNLVETAGAGAAFLVVYDGVQIPGQQIDILHCGANGSESSMLAPAAVYCRNGIVVQNASGGGANARWNLFYVPVTDMVHFGDTVFEDIYLQNVI